MTGWRGTWLAAQTTGIIVSTLVWIVLAGGWPVAAVALAASITIPTLAWNTRAVLWWRHGVVPLPPLVSDRVWEALAPIRSLHGRGQPALWWGRWNTDLLVATGRHLILGGPLVDQIAHHRITDPQLAAIILHAVGCAPVTTSRMVAGISGYCWPWQLASRIIQPVGASARRIPLVSTAWTIRWLILAIALIQAWQAQRWPAVIGVALITGLSLIQPRATRRWTVRLQAMGDQRVHAEGYGPTLAGLLTTGAGADLTDLERARRLARATP